MWITSSLTTAITPTAIALGNFDGVHLGHQGVIQQVLSQTAGLGAPHPSAEGLPPAPLKRSPLAQETLLRGFSRRDGHSPHPEPAHGFAQRHQSPMTTPMPTVMTFFPHPQEFFTGQSRPLLTPIPEKAARISQLGIGQLVLLPFNRELAELSPREFVETLLIEQLKVRHISVGQDFCFGKKRQGTVEDLKALAQPYGVAVQVAPLSCLNHERISSSRVRAALSAGDLATAETLLGRPYSLTGRVIKGQQLGRTLGFPTANLHVTPEKFLPPHGVYSVWVQGATTVASQSLPGVMNIGLRPTVQGLNLTVEVHLLNWSGDLYGKTLQVWLQNHLRPEQKFESLDALKDQIQRDCQAALASLAKAPVANLD